MINPLIQLLIILILYFFLRRVYLNSILFLLLSIFSIGFLDNNSFLNRIVLNDMLQVY